MRWFALVSAFSALVVVGLAERAIAEGVPDRSYIGGSP
jgi:hypothetical protein